MSFLGNMFKKKDPFADLPQQQPLQSATGLDNSLNMDSGLQLDALNQPEPNMKQDSFGNQKPARSFSAPDMNQTFQPAPDIGKDMEIIIAKLDTIKAEVQNLNHRLDLMERKQQAPPGEKKYLW